jgi:hypothetical protein
VVQSWIESTDVLPITHVCAIITHPMSKLKGELGVSGHGRGSPMSIVDRDDAPAEFSLSRRRILISGGVLIGGLAAVQGVATSAANAPGAEFANQFMELSSLLIAHQLDRDVGLRLAAALKMKEPAFTAQVVTLIEIAKRNHAKIVEEFFSDIPIGPLKDTALLIISAWYLGVIVDEPDAEVFAYELALMYQPTRDVMTIPTYAIAGPNGWTSKSPPLNTMPKF